MEQTEKTVHEIKMDGRAQMRVSGVEDVIGFDDTAVAVSSCMGILNIEGSALHIVKLDVSGGILEMTGHFDSLYYTEPSTKKRGLFGKRT
ncbi:MAG: YabP/YqfC family sporulation protein [Clostridia bacterium]|nr:YabP/YqfC family sporulation protein [Clostridia bacterium]